MNSRERVSAALRRTVPDRVPYCETGIDRAFAGRLMGWREQISQAANLEVNQFSVDEAKAIARKLGTDNISYVLRAPVYAEKHPGMDGRLFYGNGLIKTRADLPMLQLPDPRNDSLYEEAEQFARNKGAYSAWFVTRVGIFPTWLSMGIERFSIALYDDRSFVEEVLDTYCDWAAVVAERACQLGFDVFVSTDDMAFKTGPFFSPKVFRELVLPRFSLVASNITLPWVVHSDGNVVPFLHDLVGLGISGIHPIEEGAMDIRAIKRDYGDKLCLLGNVDLNILGNGSRSEVIRTVEGLIRDVGPGGGYIVTSGNSLAGYLRPENVLAMSEAVKQYGRYPL
jgi:uroporphyrinogen decarboxylase